MDYRAFSNQGFLFQETLGVARLLAQGCSAEAIRRQIIENDLLGLRSVKSRQTVAAALLERLRGVAPSFVTHLLSVPPDTQRALVLVLIARGHRLLAETLLEVQRWQSVQSTVTVASWRGFFERVRLEEEVLGAWSDATFRKSVANIGKYLKEARLVVPVRAGWELRTPLLSQADRRAICVAFGPWGLRVLSQAEVRHD